MFDSIKNKAITIVFAALFAFALSMPENALSQSPSNEPIDTTNSPYFLSVVGGYNGLFTGSKLTENTTGTDYIHGTSIAFSFDYKLPLTNSYIQVLTESSRMNFKTDIGDDFQTLWFATIGLKFHPKKIENLYLTIGAGIMTGSDISTQMIMSINLGYDIIKDKNKAYYIQLGTYVTDFGDNFITFRFGIRLNL